MSWHCSRALVAEYLAANYSDGERYAQSSTTPMPEAYYWPDKTTEHSRLSRFGMTSEPLTERLGAGMLMWFREAFHARTSAQQGGAMDWTANVVGYGRKWLGLLARHDPDTSSWRTPQCSLVEGLDEFSETWPEWGSMRNGECWEREMSQPLMYEKGSGYWHTVTSNDCKPAGKKEIEMVSKWEQGEWIPNTYIRLRSQVAVRSNMSGPLNPPWTEWLMGWPIGWTELKPLGTAKFQEWLQQHGESLPMNEAA